VRVVRAYAQEEAEQRQFDEPNREYVARNIKLIRTWSMFMPSLQALIGTTFPDCVVAGRTSITAWTDFTGRFDCFQRLSDIAGVADDRVGWVTNIFQRGAASMGRLSYILSAQPSIDDSAAKVSPNTKPGG